VSRDAPVRPRVEPLDLIRLVLAVHYRWTWAQVESIPDHLLIAVLDA
jgi:hypothetical protein